MAKAATAPAGGFFANWRQNIIYIGFVVIFVIFALTFRGTDARFGQVTVTSPDSRLLTWTRNSVFVFLLVKA